MTQGQDLLAYLAQKPQRDQAADQRLEERFRSAIAPIFWPVAEDMRAGLHREYMLGGGRGSCKSSFASCVILRELARNPLGNALVIRKIGNTLRNSVYEQMLWAVDVLGLAEEWTATISPMELTNTRTGQKIYFRGLDKPRKLKSIKAKRGYFAVVWFEELDELEGMDMVRSVVQ